jgi:hypothetical protein
VTSRLDEATGHPAQQGIGHHSYQDLRFGIVAPPVGKAPADPGMGRLSFGWRKKNVGNNGRRLPLMGSIRVPGEPSPLAEGSAHDPASPGCTPEEFK